MTRVRNGLKTPSEASEAAKHEADHGQVDPGLGGGAEALVILAQPAFLAPPREGAFDRPAVRRHRRLGGGRCLLPAPLRVSSGN